MLEKITVHTVVASSEQLIKSLSGCAMQCEARTVHISITHRYRSLGTHVPNRNNMIWDITKEQDQNGASMARELKQRNVQTYAAVAPKNIWPCVNRESTTERNTMHARCIRKQSLLISTDRIIQQPAGTSTCRSTARRPCRSQRSRLRGRCPPQPRKSTSTPG